MEDEDIDLEFGTPTSANIALFVTYVNAMLSESNQSQRLFLLNGRLLAWIKNPDLPVDSVVPQLLRTVFDTIYLFSSDRPCRVAVEDILRHAAARCGSKLLLPFSRAFERQTSSLLRNKVSLHPYFVLFRWSVAVIAGCSREFVESPVASTVIIRQAQLLGVLASAPNHNVLRSATSCFSRALATLPQPQAAELYVQVIAGADPLDGDTSFLVGPLLQVAPQLHSALLQLFLKMAFLGKSGLSNLQFAAWAKLIEMLSVEDLNTHVWPTIAKAVKRSPEFAIDAVRMLVPLLRVSLLPFVSEHLLPPVMDVVRSSDALQRKSGVLLVSQLCTSIQESPAPFVHIAQVLQDLLRGGSLSYNYQRTAVVECMSALVQAKLDDSSRAAISGLFVPCIATLLPKETAIETAAAMLNAAGTWAAVTDPVPASLISCYTVLLKDKDDTKKRLALDSMNVAFTDVTVAQASPLVAPLLAIVKGLAAKPANLPLAISAVRFFARAAKTADAEKLWPQLLAPSAFVFSTALDKLLGEDLQSFIDLVRIIATSRLQAVIAAKSYDALVDLSLRLLCHSSWVVRKSARSALNEVHKVDGNFSTALLDALLFGPILDSLAIVESPNVGESLILGALGSDPSVDVLPQAMLVSHHPNVAPENEFVWLVVRRHFGDEKLRTLLNSAPTVAALLSDERILLGTPQKRSMAASTARALSAFSVHPDLAVCVLEQAVLPALNPERLAKLSEKELAIYFTPAGQMYQQPDEAFFVPQVVEATNVRRSRAEAKTYKLDEEEQKQQREAAKAKAEADAVARKQEILQKHLAKEAEVRKQVALFKANMQPVFQLIIGLCEGNHVVMRAHLAALLDALRPFLAHKLFFEDLALPVLQSLATCMDFYLRPVSDLLARALLAVLPFNNARLVAKMPTDVQLVTIRAVVALHEQLHTQIQEHGDVTPSSFMLFFPIVVAALRLPPANANIIAVQGTALKVLRMHSQPQHTEVPRAAIIAILFYVLSHGAVPLQSAASGVLAIAAEGAVGDDLKAFFESGLMNSLAHVRFAALTALERTPQFFTRACTQSNYLSARLFLARTDPDSENAQVADRLWDAYGYGLERAYSQEILPLLSHTDALVRQCAATTLAAGLKELHLPADELLKQLFVLYANSLPGVARPDTSGKSKDPAANTRSGVALALQACAEDGILVDADVAAVFDFVLLHALVDNNADVRQQMIQASIDIINTHPVASVQLLMSKFEGQISSPEQRIREAVVVFLGAVARHLPANSPKVTSIMDSLIDALQTQSVLVQNAVANCLPPLMPAVSDRSAQLIDTLFERLTTDKKQPNRRGAAAGLAGVVKGLGLAAIKQHDLINRMKAALEDKQASARQGALMALEQLCLKLGRLFEPFVIQILPHLLSAYNDTAGEVRESTQAASRAIMAQLSGHGVKLVLPSLLRALDNEGWRTKQGSAQMLGAMAFCAPRQLPACLPAIVPKLSETLTDSHPKVVEASLTALKQVGSVIRNPEIQQLVPTMLNAMSDSDNIPIALDALISTSFVHSMDVASLALVVPTVVRAMKNRTIDTKKKAAQITGSLVTLAGKDDLIPYLPVITPQLKVVLLDPIPEVRSVAAKAFGSLVGGLGEDYFPDLVSWLMATLRSDQSTVERSGAAQGLSEVLANVDISRFEGLVGELVAGSSSRDPFVREGVLGLFVYLPHALGDAFQPFIAPLLNGIISGLADESDAVRETALKASRMLIACYALSALPLLLPALQNAVFHDNWRIRQSAVQLLGELLYRIANDRKSARSDEVELPTIGTDTQMRAVMQVLGADRRAEVLAALYLVRLDVSAPVRAVALQVWKSLVVNTPRTLREILPQLVDRIIDSLASGSADRQDVASRTLGEVVKKLGDRVLPDILPQLKRGLSASSPNQRRGVALGIAEAIDAAGKQLISNYLDEVIPAVRFALCDPNADVREAASQAFAMLHRHAGSKAIDDIVPDLLDKLSRHYQGDDMPEGGSALEGLKQILSVRSHVVLPYLIPKLMQPPITAFRARALASLAEVAGGSLSTHLGTLLPALIDATSSDDLDTAEAASLAAQNVALALPADWLHVLMSEIQKGLTTRKAHIRIGNATLVTAISAGGKVNLEAHLTMLLQELIQLLDDEEPKVVVAAHAALDALCKTIRKDDQAAQVAWIRECANQTRARSKNKLLPGLCLPKGLGPFVPVLMYALMNGTPEQRESAALGLGDLISMTSAEALKPFVVQMTGPLIRVVGEKFSWKVKSAILQTLCSIIDQAGMACKMFSPQLQPTFIKNITDPSAVVRRRAVEGIARLITLKPKMDNVVSEIMKGYDDSMEGPLKAATLRALQMCLQHGGDTISPTISEPLYGMFVRMIDGDDDALREPAALALGAYCKFASQKEVTASLSKLLSMPDVLSIKLAYISAVVAILRNWSDAVQSSLPAIMERFAALLKDDKVPIRQAGVRGLVALLCSPVAASIASDVLPLVIAKFNDSDVDVRREALVGVKDFAKAQPDIVTAQIGVLLPPLYECSKDRATLVRTNAERALLHVLQVRSGAKSLQAFIALDSATGKMITEYAKRVLTKLPAESDVEE
eukprot:TRINITY_DN4753_c0_g1_i1.p1 TRINITY_DN4753_c0_g1~~TRINITY_DN4753_c0_g1_i1.p1  ORF type:complete len:2587 (+),score=586.43 TRINITY_DN4753_c0_g1_i1:38-7798(+)